MKKLIFEIGKFKLYASDAPQSQILYALEHGSTRVSGTMISECKKHNHYRAILAPQVKCEHCVAIRAIVEAYTQYATKQTQAEGT